MVAWDDPPIDDMERWPTKEATVQRCPHDDIRHCPLYVAAHDEGAADYSCDDGELGPMPTGCAVSRGYSYANALKGLMRVAPDLVKECRAAEAAAASQAQRERNMRLAAVQ